jgi:hypothetical protein
MIGEKLQPVSTPTLGDATRSKIPGGVRGIQNSRIQNEYSVSILLIWNGWLISAVLY